MLVKLPCGSWVEAEDIRTMRVIPDGKNNRISVTTKSQSFQSDQIADAQQVLQDLAQLVNTAKLIELNSNSQKAIDKFSRH